MTPPTNPNHPVPALVFQPPARPKLLAHDPLPAGHPHVWNVEHADEHLDPLWRKRWMPEGGHIVVTRQMRSVAASMPAALDRCATIAVTGPWGTGKSTLIASLAGVADVQVAVADLARGQTTNRNQWDIISTAVTGRPGTGTATQMQEATAEYLHTVPTLLVVDEAQHLNRATLLQLRWLWSQPYDRFAILLAGTNLDAHLDADPAIGTRIDRRVRINHLTIDRLIETLRAHHPTVAATHADVLAYIDRVYAHGLWRHWTKLMRVICNDWKHTGPIDLELAVDAIAEVIGGEPGDIEATMQQLHVATLPTSKARRQSRR